MIESLIGQRYRIKALIGEGGMASVYSAIDEKLERKVAIKVMHPHLARNPDIRERFLLEARTVSGLDHPNILRVYDFSGLDSEQLWIVMEILNGEDLSEYVKRFPKNRLQFIVAALVTREICRALHEAHKLDIVHRDIKPENIMMLKNGQLKLMDFGIAKVHRANATQTGIFMGSPSYMSPEQIRGTDVDSRADIYSLAVLFYEIVTGQLPFVGKTTAEVINRIMVGRYTAPNLLVTELPSPLNNIIIKGLAHHKDERFANVTEMALALDNFLLGVNFKESRIELEEFTLNRTKFEERIAEILTVPPTALNALAPDEVSPHFRSQVTRFQASYEQGANEGTMILDANSSPTIPPESLNSPPGLTIPPPSLPNALGTPEGDRNSRDEMRAPSPPKGDRISTPPAQNSQKSSRLKQSSHPPASSRGQKQATNHPSPMRNATQSPRTSQNQNSSHMKSTNYKAVYREFQEEEKTNRSNLGLVAAIIVVAAAILFFVINSDKSSTKNPKQPIKVTESTKTPKKKPEIEKEAEPTLPTPVPVEGTETKPQDQTAQTPDPAVSQTPSTTPSTAQPTETPKPNVATRPPVKTQTPPARPPVTRPQTPVTRPVVDAKPVPVPPANTQTPVKQGTLASLPPEKTPEDKVPEKTLPPPAKDKPQATGPGHLRLAALPAAEVYLDGKLYGTTNDKQFGSQGIKLDSGTYMLRLKRKGYKTEEQAIQIKPGEMRQINVTLQKLAEFVELTIRVNKLPANITIEEVKNGGRKRELPMIKNSQQVNLKPGSYRVIVSHEGEAINRTMELTEENKAITFNADFK